MTRLTVKIIYSSLVICSLGQLNTFTVRAQETPAGKSEDDQQFFDGIFLEEDDDRAAEVLKDLLDSWIEKPLNINSDHAGQLAEYGMISLYQWNKLLEYRLIYGDMVSVYELKNVEGWDRMTARRVAPYLTTTGVPDDKYSFSIPTSYIKQQLVLKTNYAFQMRRGYLEPESGDTNAQRQYLGSPLRLGLRYDLMLHESIRIGIRSEKDPGEPWLVKNDFFEGSYHGPDHLSGFLQFNFRGPIKSVILGDYRLAFGFGVNYSGGNRMFGSREGLTQPANRLQPNTSMSESGYLRGGAIQIRQDRVSLTAFASSTRFDGTSLEIDSLSGDALSFSGINTSGLHRTLSELEQRKELSEKIFGGILTCSFNWIKTGIICYYNQFGQTFREKTEPYARFGFHGRSNLVGGLTLAAMLKGIRLVSEISLSRNGGFAIIAGTEVSPGHGFSINAILRHFDMQYQNLHGAGFSSAGKNNDETGIQTTMRLETPRRWVVHLTADVSRSRWVTYQLNAPSKRWQAILLADRAWRDQGAVTLSVKYCKETIDDPLINTRIMHPFWGSKLSFRLEGRLMALECITLKSKIDINSWKSFHNHPQWGYLVLQDIGYSPTRFPVHFWMRIGIFLSESYNTRLYAYENDVLYDFTSFMHDGKGLRNVWMVRYSPWDWLDCWVRLASVTYRDRPVTGSGWDQVEGYRLDELEVQIRLKVAHQYSFSRFKR